VAYTPLVTRPAGAGPVDPAGLLLVDLDSTICAVYGRAKQGADFGYTKVRGYHPQLAALAETGQVIFSRMRGGAAHAARGAKSFLTETISRLREAGATGPITVRANSAFYSRAVLCTARTLGVRFSVTARQDKRIRATIAAIGEHAWQRIPTGPRPRRSPAPTSPTCPTRPSPARRTQWRCGWWSAAFARRPGRSWRCSPTGPTS